MDDCTGCQASTQHATNIYMKLKGQLYSNFPGEWHSTACLSDELVLILDALSVGLLEPLLQHGTLLLVLQQLRLHLHQRGLQLGHLGGRFLGLCPQLHGTAMAGHCKGTSSSCRAMQN
jgi:hypothetical protein